MGHYREALEAFKRSNPNNAWVHLGLIYSYMELGSQREALMETREVMRIVPNFSLALAQRRLPGYFDDSAGRHYLDDLRKAGLKRPSSNRPGKQRVGGRFDQAEPSPGCNY